MRWVPLNPVCTAVLTRVCLNPVCIDPCVSQPRVSPLLLGPHYTLTCFVAFFCARFVFLTYPTPTSHPPRPTSVRIWTVPPPSLSLDSPARFGLLDLPEDMKQIERLVLKGKKGGHDNLTEMEKSMELIESWGRAFLQVRGER